jgi:predicted protein tyrosine phosphatase
MARLRSKTAYTLFGGDYAGTDTEADRHVTKEQMDWADVIYCMEMRHRSKLRRKFKGYSKKMRVLNIPDDYEYMNEELISLLRSKTRSVS